MRRSWRMCRIMGIAMPSEAVANQNTYSRCENRANQNSFIAKPRPASLFPYTTFTPLSMTNQNSRCHFKATPHLSLPLRRVKSSSDAHELCTASRGNTLHGVPTCEYRSNWLAPSRPWGDTHPRQTSIRSVDNRGLRHILCHTCDNRSNWRPWAHSIWLQIASRKTANGTIFNTAVYGTPFKMQILEICIFFIIERDKI